MGTLVTSLAASFAIIFMAELGDKTQLLTMALATRYRLRVVVSAIALAAGVLMLVAVVFGEAIRLIIPPDVLRYGAAAAFLGFAIWVVWPRRSARATDDEKRSGGFWTIAGTFIVAELGDKTQLTTLTLATRFGSPVGVFIGATLGLVAADLLAIYVGNRLGKHLPEVWLHRVSAALFVVFAVVTVLSG